MNSVDTHQMIRKAEQQPFVRNKHPIPTLK